MDRCALIVDASYVLADGAMAVHGTRRRESVSWDYAGLVQLFGNLAVERTKLPVLRTYWYEATAEDRRSADHDTLADLPGVKLRVAKTRPGRRESVEGEIQRDLTALARNKAVSDVMLVSAEEDLTQVIADVQDMGMKVTLLQITGDGGGASSRALRQECDDVVEVSAAHLRPYVELISGAEPPRADESDGAVALRPAVNGNGYNGNTTNTTNTTNGNAGIGTAGNAGNGNGRAPAAHAAAYAQPHGRPGSGQQSPAPARHAAEYQRITGGAAPDQAAHQVPQPAALDSGQPDAGHQERTDSAVATEFAPAGDYAANLDYSASVDYGVPADRSAAADQGPASDFGPSFDYATAAEYNPAPDYPAPDYPAAVSAAAAPPREELYAAPVSVPAASDELPGDLDRLSASSRMGTELSAYNPGAVRDQYRRDGGYREAAGGDLNDRLQPVPVAVPSGGSAQIRRLPTRGPGPAGPHGGQSSPALPPALPAPSMTAPFMPAPSMTGMAQSGMAQPGMTQPGMTQPGQAQPETAQGQPDGRMPGGQVTSGQPTGGQPAVPVAPVVSLEQNGMGYASRGGSYGGPRQVFPGPGSGGPVGSGGPIGSGAPVGLAGPGGPGANQGQGPGPVPPGSQPSALPAPGGQQDAGGQSGPIGQSGPGGQSGPIGLVGPGGYAAGPGVSLADAVQSAHEEGQAFGESVARDAPALWLEAVLARKPRMPSDLEARLLQGSTLPIDFLLHDEVRHALRRGFWDALERARR